MLSKSEAGNRLIAITTNGQRAKRVLEQSAEIGSSGAGEIELLVGAQRTPFHAEGEIRKVLRRHVLVVVLDVADSGGVATAVFIGVHRDGNVRVFAFGEDCGAESAGGEEGGGEEGCEKHVEE